MAAEDQPAEHRIGEVTGIVVADLQAGQRLAPLPIDFFRREGRVLDEVGGQPKGQIRLVLDHGAADRRHLVTGADANHASG